MVEKVLQTPFLGATLSKIRGRAPAVVVVALSLALTAFMTIQGGSGRLINILVTGGMWALLAAGLALVFGVMNIPTFAHGESFMIGAYCGYYIFNPIHNHLVDHPNQVMTFFGPILAIMAATVAGAIVGAITERLVLAPLRRRTRDGWIMNTFLLTAGISFVLINGATIVMGSNFMGIPHYYDVHPVKVLGQRMSVDRILAFTIAVVIIALLTWFMKYARTGRAIRAVSQDEAGALMVGINLNYIHTLTYALSTAMAAAAGAALLFMFQAYPTVGHDPNYYAWYVVMLVGFGNIYGAVVGGFIVALLQAATQQYIGIAWSDVVPTFVMILILIVVPSGIFGSVVKGIHEQS